MELNKTYTSKSGAKRTPLYFSDCKRFVFVLCVYPDGKIMDKCFWACHHLFN